MTEGSLPDGHAASSAPRPLRRDAAENRRRLLDAARTVFAERGMDAGVEDVARTAGVGVGTLYRRFPTKDALVAELVHEFMENAVSLARDAGSVSGGGGLEQLVFALGEVQAENRGCLARIWTDEASSALRDEYRRLSAALLADARRHGTIRSDAVATDLDLVFWSLRGIIETTGDSAPVAWRRQAAILLAGLRPSSHPLGVAPISEAVVARTRESSLST
ncbi:MULTISPECIES: TetR/AcrR family transcriptional regulator [unclassified Rhodococcus (in: high G+C Gram-positive bacteria)]|uniref:TetR/AcrR family transcriptional regulator n=1 Tax=unclassified Rhodococcus (in: high G+C Gram-positive bacteria) TaxID=192944 RepID=UPI0006FB5985|nr:MULTISPECIES: TetR/AcrR family transcriptional regulator [unclassified Rhodococcus (in: high G+C Gram-positive bacteria)]KQU38397.1 TetR family transcriptional regulator [Rhodococcus sp. Leaf225]KQU39760.1 TetR family transcriptional regulator [Rhodococcus sp. Leaf258]